MLLKELGEEVVELLEKVVEAAVMAEAVEVISRMISHKLTRNNLSRLDHISGAATNVSRGVGICPHFVDSVGCGICSKLSWST